MKVSVSVNKLLNRCNLTKNITDHLCNEHYTKLHRRITGGILIFFGVIISKCGGEFAAVHIVCDAFGYAIHGIGLIPFISDLEKN